MLPAGGGRLSEPFDLMLPRGHVDHAGLIPSGIDPARVERLADGGEVLAPEPEKRVDLIGPSRQPVLEPMAQRRLDETAVPAARAPAAAIALEQDDAFGRRGQQGCPQTGEAAADDRQVALRLTLERRKRLRRRGRVEPEDALLGVGERADQPLRSQSSTSAACPSGGKMG